jgi:hypothetical protein
MLSMHFLRASACFTPREDADIHSRHRLDVGRQNVPDALPVLWAEDEGSSGRSRYQPLDRIRLRHTENLSAWSRLQRSGAG